MFYNEHYGLNITFTLFLILKALNQHINMCGTSIPA